MNQCVLIDDDKLIHMLWKMEAEKAATELLSFYTVEEFLTTSDKFSKDIPIYIDSDLGHEVKGEIESEKIYKLGFTQLYLATGYDPKDITKPHWIKEIVGKRPLFNNDEN